MVEILKRLFGEDITVSTTAIGPTVVNIPSGTIMASFVCRTGGKIIWNITTIPIDTGAAGDVPQQTDDRWEIWGYDNIIDMKMIKQNGQSDQTVAVQYFGEGKT